MGPCLADLDNGWVSEDLVENMGLWPQGEYINDVVLAARGQLHETRDALVGPVRVVLETKHIQLVIQNLHVTERMIFKKQNIQICCLLSIYSGDPL